MPRAPARVWFEAARPRTLAAGATPVIVGTAAAGRVVAWRAAAAMVVALALQVGVNFANDLFDAGRGVDAPERRGPRRAVAAGLVTPGSMKVAVAACIAVAGVSGAALAAAVGYELLLVGAACFAAALAYSGGPRPYASAGLGELFVFVFFGLVATAGSAYVQRESLDGLALTAALPVGALAAAILVANNLRDSATDASAGKATLAVRLGPRRTRHLYRVLVVGALISTAVVALVARSPWPLIALGATPLARPGLRLIERERAPDLVAALVCTARLELVTGLLLAAGLWAAR